jgi:ABC-type transport system involved in multi-copper enzyme maturation permease subunit
VDLHVSIKIEKLLDPLLPYAAVFKQDFAQTTRGWVYRLGLGAVVMAALGHLLYRTLMHHQAGVPQDASRLMADLLQYCLYLGAALVVLLTAGAIAGERDTLADGVLSRGVTRYQYFLGKWHARLVAVLGAFGVLGFLALSVSVFVLRDDVVWLGGLKALGMVAAVLTLVASVTVTLSALVRNVLLCVTLALLVVYGTGLTLTMMPAGAFSPRLLHDLLPMILRNDQATLSGDFMVVLFGLAVIVPLAGMLPFGRKDI